MKHALIMVLVITGCEARAATQSDAHPVLPAPTKAADAERMVPAASPASSAAPLPPGTSAASARPSHPTASALREVLSAARKQLIDTIVARDVLTLGPDAASARFAPVVSLQRVRETVDGFDLEGTTPTEQVQFSFAPDGTYCSVATLALYASSPEEATTLRNAVEKQLRAKLGKPKGTPYWKLDRRVGVSLLEYKSRRAVPGERIVELRISEEDGEPS